MLLACSRCHRQYDVGVYPEGSLVRCLCGTQNKVPKVRARQVEMLHCSNCGGKLAGGARTCAYCGSEVQQADRGLGPACPECFAMTLPNARHCSSCGVRLEAQVVIRALLDRPCPRCRKPLSECEGEDKRYVECPGCGGLWLDEALFERLARDREKNLVPAIRGTLPAPAAAASPAREVVRYLPCPVCTEVMNRRNFAGCSGVILDWCRGHGWWFDAHELERVVEFLEKGGMERARRMEQDRAIEQLRRERERNTQHVDLPIPDRHRRSVAESLLDYLLDWIHR